MRMRTRIYLTMAAALRMAALERSFLYPCLMREPLVWWREEGERQELEDQRFRRTRSSWLFWNKGRTG